MATNTKHPPSCSKHAIVISQDTFFAVVLTHFRVLKNTEFNHIRYPTYDSTPEVKGYPQGVGVRETFQDFIRRGSS